MQPATILKNTLTHHPPKYTWEKEQKVRSKTSSAAHLFIVGFMASLRCVWYSAPVECCQCDNVAFCQCCQLSICHAALVGNWKLKLPTLAQWQHSIMPLRSSRPKFTLFHKSLIYTGIFQLFLSLKVPRHGGMSSRPPGNNKKVYIPSTSGRSGHTFEVI